MHCAICGYEKCVCLPIPEALKNQYSQMTSQIESSYYPKDKSLFYVEFNRGGIPLEFTLFQRHFFHSPEEWEKIKNMEGFVDGIMSNEGHPYQLFTGTYGPDGCYPDQSWVMWMVDAINEKAKRS